MLAGTFAPIRCKACILLLKASVKGHTCGLAKFKCACSACLASRFAMQHENPGFKHKMRACATSTVSVSRRGSRGAD